MPDNLCGWYDYYCNDEKEIKKIEGEFFSRVWDEGFWKP